jgi:hypothetical protein
MNGEGCSSSLTSHYFWVRTNYRQQPSNTDNKQTSTDNKQTNTDNKQTCYIMPYIDKSCGNVGIDSFSQDCIMHGFIHFCIIFVFFSMRVMVDMSKYARCSCFDVVQQYKSVHLVKDT